MTNHTQQEMKKDWKGNRHTNVSTVGSTAHATHERPLLDYYATPPNAVRSLLSIEHFDTDIWEPACGEGHISRVIAEAGYRVRSSDIVDRGYGDVADFLSIDNVEPWHGDIITNPPYRYAEEFLTKAMQLLHEGGRYCALLRLQFLEGKSRRQLFKNYPPEPYGYPPAAWNVA